MKQEHLDQFTASVEEALTAAFGLTELAVDPEGDWPFTLDGARVWVRVVAEPDLHVYLFTRVAEAIVVGEETLREVNRLNAVMTAGSLVLTDDSTIIASMRLHRSMTNAESLRIVIAALASYVRELGPLFSVIHGGGDPLEPPPTRT